MLTFMNTVQGILISHYAEYLVIAPNWRIRRTSANVQRFANGEEVKPGKDVRLSFPELVGVESYLSEILLGKRNSFELKGIARKDPSSPLYIDLYITNLERELIVLLDDATERMVLQQKLVQNNHKMKLLLQKSTAARNYVDKILMSIADALFVTTPLGNILTVNQAAINLFEYSQEELINQSISHLITDDNILPTSANINSQSYYLHNHPVICQTKTGKKLTVAFSCSVMETEIHGLQNFIYIGRDITQRCALEQQLFEEKELALVTLQSIGDGVITTDAEGKIKYINPIAEQLTSWNLEDAQGKSLVEVFKMFHETTREAVENPVQQALSSGCSVSFTKDSILITRNNIEIAIDVSAAPIRAKDGEIVGAVMVFQDVSQKRSMAHQLSWQATHDALTGLLNRHEFEFRLEQALNTARITNKQHALCYLDLDRFKIVNDTCGHLAGDELLRQVAALLQLGVRSSDSLARLGGDEFGILLEGCPLEPAFRIANKLVQSIQEFRFIWQEKTFNIGVSIGLVGINADSQTMNSVLTAADAACYLAKNNGRNRVHIYQADDSDLVKARSEIQWVARITQALEDNRFCLYYQAIIPINSNRNSSEHYEVLLRLIDETGNLVSPMAFLPAAERYNLMQAIDRWVICTLFTSLAQCGREKLTDGTSEGCNCNCIYAVNLSGASINDDQFIDFLCEQFTLYQVPPQTICFEITETVAIANLSKAASFISSLRELGCCFALDDFGSGMSSFNYLKNLPIDYLKIDGSFVKHIVNEPIDLAMVEAINQIGHVMGIQTIAECVEDEKILAKIKAIGVDYAQGYGVAKPCPLSHGRLKQIKTADLL